MRGAFNTLPIYSDSSFYVKDLIVLSGRNNPTDAAARFFNIATSSGDQMNMSVKDRLAGISATVETEIKTGD